jgi:apoptosis-inducing factor 3
MMGHEAPFREAPFFWSNQGDKRLDYAGYAPDWERIEIKGETAKLDFIAYYIRGGKAVAACAIGHNPEMIRYLDMLATNGPPTAETLA